MGTYAAQVIEDVNTMPEKVYFQSKEKKKKTSKTSEDDDDDDNNTDQVYELLDKNLTLKTQKGQYRNCQRF